MARIFDESSRTFGEFLLIPNLTTKDCIPSRVSLQTPLVKHRRGEAPALSMNVPIVSAMMQSVSGADLAISLARCGGLAFIFGSQSIAAQAGMVAKAKNYKAGFVDSDSNLRPDATLADVLALTAATGHSTIPVTDDGTPHGKLEGLVTGRDYRTDRMAPETRVSTFMTPFAQLHCGQVGCDLVQANDLIWEHKLNCLPIVDGEQRLRHLVFRKDHDEHRANPLEVVDKHKRLLVGAALNTRDFTERAPAVIEAGADILCIDSSDGFSEWQRDTIAHVKSRLGAHVPVGAGNIVDRDGFQYLVDSGADFVKVGIGGGSICITRVQKGIGRGQASALMDVAQARDEYFEKTGIYIPICSDGGITQDYQLTLALAMGADFIMMGRYFARFDEAPGRKLWHQNMFVKEYWGEGSERARNWQRYDMGGSKTAMQFEEGVDSYVPYAGRLKDNLELTLDKVRSTMCNCGALSIPELQRKARLTLASAVSLHEGEAHDVILKDTRNLPPT